MRKVFLIFGIIVAVASLAFWGRKYLPLKAKRSVIQTFSTKQNPAFRAVPQKSPLIIEIKDQEGFLKALDGGSQVLNEFKTIPEVGSVFSGIDRFHRYAEGKSGIAELLKNKSVIISVNPSGKNQLTCLFLAQLNNSGESGSAVDIVSRELGSQFSISRKSYDNTFIVNAKSANLNFYFACTNDIFMVSEDFILVEEAIRQSNSVNLSNNREFTAAYKTIDETALANVFINHQTISQFLSKVVSPEVKKYLSQLNFYSNWSAIDVTVKSNKLVFNGYSITKDSTDTYLNIFKNQEAGKFTIDEAVPANSSLFVVLNLKNTRSYIDRYETYLRTRGNFYPRENSLTEFKKKTNVDLEHLVKEMIGNEIAGVYTNINKSNLTQNRFFVARINESSEAKEKLRKAVAEFRKSDTNSNEPEENEFSAGKNESFNIYRLPLGNVAECFFGRTFSGINGQYFTIYRKYLICGDNLQGMKNYLQSLASGQILSKDSVYQKNKKEMQPNPNFYLYTRIPKIFRLKDALLRAEISEIIGKNEDVVGKFSIFSWQISASGDMVKNQLLLRYDPDIKEEPQSVWQLRLNGPLAQKPALVLNHKDMANREVIVCDKQNNLSLVNKEGQALWSINIPGEIISDIHQIDLYQNNKFQYLFNTKTQLYCIDRLGNKVGKFPIALKSMASNGVSVIGYDNNKEYRFVIAGEDHKIYLFDRDGKPVSQWNFEGTESNVNQPVQHFNINGKDYIVVYDKRNIYFLDRQGRNRGGRTEPFERSSNPVYFVDNGTPQLIATDPKGRIHLIDFSGEAQVKEVGNFTTAHRFVACDLDKNGSPEFIFADGKKLTIYSSDGKKSAEHTFPDSISETPDVFDFGTGKKIIGVVIKGENKVYLLDKNGAVIRGLPLEGDTRFTFGKFNDANSWYNLVVGSQGGSLVNYRIE
jgi:hypothetical protein